MPRNKRRNKKRSSKPSYSSDEEPSKAESKNSGDELDDMMTKLSQKPMSKTELKKQKRLAKQQRRNAAGKGKKNMGKGKKGKKGQHDSDSDDAFDADDNMRDISIPDIMVRVPGKVLLRDTKLKVSDKRRYGLIGVNGSGKSTLIKQIATRELKIPRRIDMIHIEQENALDGSKTVFETVLESNKERIKLMAKRDELIALMEVEGDDGIATVDDSLMERYDKIEEKLDGMRTEHSKVNKILLGMGFTSDTQKQQVDTFSGGWRMRISLARALYMKPTLLLLDEPTNHLDIDAVVWLTDYLREWKNTLMVVSHNKYFLDQICTDIIHLRDQKLFYYNGNYTQFKKMREQEMAKHVSDWNKVMSHLNKMKKDSKPRKDQNAYIAKSGITKPERPYSVMIDLSRSTMVTENLVKITGLSFGYAEDHDLFTDLHLGIAPDTKIVIMGANGVGKSTLLQLIAEAEDLGFDEMDVIKKNNRLRVGYYHQHSAENLPKDVSCVEYLKSLDSDVTIATARRYLGAIGLEGTVHLNKIGTLSGGQKSRVAIAALQVQSPHLLLLDEPTNHLDIETVEALAEAIDRYDGAVIMVTHDVELITSTGCVLMELCDQSLVETDYDSYEERLLNKINCVDMDEAEAKASVVESVVKVA